MAGGDFYCFANGRASGPVGNAVPGVPFPRSGAGQARVFTELQRRGISQKRRLFGGRLFLHNGPRGTQDPPCTDFQRRNAGDGVPYGDNVLFFAYRFAGAPFLFLAVRTEKRMRTDLPSRRGGHWPPFHEPKAMLLQDAFIRELS